MEERQRKRERVRENEKEKNANMRKESSEMYIGTIILHDKTLKIEF